MNIAETLCVALYYTGQVLVWLIIIRCILSMFGSTFHNGLMRILYNVTDCFLLPVQALLKKTPLGNRAMPIDFSPWITIILIQSLSSILIQLVSRMAL